MADRRYKDKYVRKVVHGLLSHNDHRTTSKMPETRQQAVAKAEALEEAQRRANQRSNLKSAMKKAKSMDSLRDHAQGNGEPSNTPKIYGTRILGQRVSMDGLRNRVEGADCQQGNLYRSFPVKDKKPWNEMEFLLSCEQAYIRENAHPLHNDGHSINPKQLHIEGEAYVNPDLLQMQLKEFKSLEWPKLKLPDWMFDGNHGVAALKTSMLEETVDDIQLNFFEEEQIFQRFGRDGGNAPEVVLDAIEEKRAVLNRKILYSKEILGFVLGPNQDHEVDGDNLDRMEWPGLEGMAEGSTEATGPAAEVGSGHEERGRDEKQMENVHGENPGSALEVDDAHKKSDGDEKQTEELISEEDIEPASPILESVSEVSDNHELDSYDVYDIPPPRPNAGIPDTPLRGVPLPIADTEYEENLVRQYQLDTELDTDLFPELAKYDRRPSPDFLGDKPDYLEAVEPEARVQPFDYSSSRFPHISDGEFSALVDGMYNKLPAPKTKKAPAPAPVTPKKFYDQSPLKPHSSLPKRPDKVMVPSNYTPRPGDGSPPANRTAVSQGRTVSSNQRQSSHTANPIQNLRPDSYRQQGGGSPTPKRGQTSQNHSQSLSDTAGMRQGHSSTHRQLPQQQRGRSRGRGTSQTQGTTGHHSRSFSGQSNTSPTRSMFVPHQQMQHGRGPHQNDTTTNPAARAFSGRVMVDSAAPQFGQPRHYQQGNGYGTRSPTHSPTRTLQAPAPARAQNEVIRLPFPQADKRARALQTIQQLFLGSASHPGYSVKEVDGHLIVRGPVGGNLRGMIMSAFPGQKKIMSSIE